MTATLAILVQIAAPAACAPGVYLVSDDGSARPLAETRADHRKVGGLAKAMLLTPFGGGKLKVKSVLSGGHAPVQVKSGRPVFEFCFAPSAAASTSDYVGVDAAATSPAGYHLVRFDAGAEQRELALSVIGGFGGPRGTLSDSVTPFTAEPIGPGRYRVTPTRDLPPGEYGFMQPPAQAASARKKDATERVYDFGVSG